MSSTYMTARRTRGTRRVMEWNEAFPKSQGRLAPAPQWVGARSVPPGGDLGPHLVQPTVDDRGPCPADQGEEPGQVVHRQQPRRGRLAHDQHVPQIGPRPPGADGA